MTASHVVLFSMHLPSATSRWQVVSRGGVLSRNGLLHQSIATATFTSPQPRQFQRRPPSPAITKAVRRPLSTSSAMAANTMKDGNFIHDITTAPSNDRVLPLFSLKGRTAIVSGAGAGIGLAVARALAEAGADVALWYNSNEKALVRAKEIEQTFGVQCASYIVSDMNKLLMLCPAARLCVPGQCSGS